MNFYDGPEIIQQGSEFLQKFWIKLNVKAPIRGRVFGVARGRLSTKTFLLLSLPNCFPNPGP